MNKIKVEEVYVDPKATALITEALAKTYRALPYKIANNKLYVAMSASEDEQAIKAIRFASKHPIIPIQDEGRRIDDFIAYHYRLFELEELLAQLNLPDVKKNKCKKIKTLLSPKQSENIMRLIDILIELSVYSHASDIHIEPGTDDVQVRFRVSGLLRNLVAMPLRYYPMVVNRFKLMAKLNIAERKKPQDGSIHIDKANIRVSLRISTVASLHGEKIVLRVLSKSQFVRTENQLGLTESNVPIKRAIMRNSQGMIIVAGPTGSGKTTTLYSLLQELNEPRRNLVTIEDPVEYQLEGVTQIHVALKYGLTFVNVLRSVLRQDPDIILVGEIRDRETAETAFTASMTGHLILTSLHTNDTVSTILRLKDLGIEPYFIASSLKGVIAQRLMNTLCPHCREPYEVSRDEMEFLHIPETHEKLTLYKEKGCEFCQYTGYHGRVAIHEILEVNHEIRRLIEHYEAEDFETDQILEKAREAGTRTLFESGRSHVLSGLTSINELYRIAYQI